MQSLHKYLLLQKFDVHGLAQGWRVCRNCRSKLLPPDWFSAWMLYRECQDMHNSVKSVFLILSGASRSCLVFMDMQMPEMGGLEATRIIRQTESGVINPQVTIIAMTANAMESDRHLCLQAGMNDFLAKPVSRQDLSNKLEIWL